MKLIAHRGKVSKKDDPNTKTSFLKALSTSYIGGIECDVRLTKDEEVVVIHDPVIDFTSDGMGIVKQKTLKELKQYRFYKEPILTLKELLSFNFNDKLILIELKGEKDDFQLVKKVDQIIRNYPNLKIVIISFWYSLLKYLKKINPKVETGLLIGYFLNQQYLYNHFDYNLLTYQYLDQIYMHKKLMYFTINEKKQVEEILKKRTDVYLITDCADQFEHFLK